MSEVLPDHVPVAQLLTSSRDVLQELDLKDPPAKNWKHFGEVLLKRSDKDLKIFAKSESPCLAVVDKWMALHPNGLVGDLIKALEEIERNDVAKSLRDAVMESKPYKDMAKKAPRLVTQLSEEESSAQEASPAQSSPSALVGVAPPSPNSSCRLYAQQRTSSNVPEDTLDNMIWTKGSTGPEVVKRVIEVIGSLAMFPNDHGFLRRIAYVETKDGLLGGALLGGIWRVSREMLIDSQRIMAHGQLIRKHEIIRQQLNIDWPEVVWSDLQKPIYSGLAARLFLSNNPRPIPETLERQSNYWKINYNPGCPLHSEDFERDVMNWEQGQR